MTTKEPTGKTKAGRFPFALWLPCAIHPCWLGELSAKLTEGLPTGAPSQREARASPRSNPSVTAFRRDTSLCTREAQVKGVPLISLAALDSFNRQAAQVRPAKSKIWGLTSPQGEA